MLQFNINNRLPLLGTNMASFTGQNTARPVGTRRVSGGLVDRYHPTAPGAGTREGAASRAEKHERVHVCTRPNQRPVTAVTAT